MVREKSADCCTLSDISCYAPTRSTQCDLRIHRYPQVTNAAQSRFEGGGAHQVPRHLRRGSYLVSVSGLAWCGIAPRGAVREKSAISRPIHRRGFETQSRPGPPAPHLTHYLREYEGRSPDRL